MIIARVVLLSTITSVLRARRTNLIHEIRPLRAICNAYATTCKRGDTVTQWVQEEEEAGRAIQLGMIRRSRIFLQDFRPAQNLQFRHYSTCRWRTPLRNQQNSFYLSSGANDIRFADPQADYTHTDVKIPVKSFLLDMQRLMLVIFGFLDAL